MHTLRLPLALGAFSLCLLPLRAAGGDLTKIYKFDQREGTNAPGGFVRAPNGNFYGITLDGGIPNCGDGNFGCGGVFELQPPTAAGAPWTGSTIYEFSLENGDGAAGFPVVNPIPGPNGVLYGATPFGGNNESGMIFELQPPTNGTTRPWIETVLYSFPGAGEGTPSSLFLNSDGALYGTASLGGLYNGGVVFKLEPPADAGDPWTETDLYSFTGGADGAGPDALIPGGNGTLYGTTSAGGNWGAGTVFELTPPAGPHAPWTENVLHVFNGATDGSDPWASSLVLSDGVLYGAAVHGGTADYGTVYQLAPAAGGALAFSVIFDFGTPHGCDPNSPLLVWNGKVFGTASLMITGDPILGSNGSGGVLFELDNPGQGGGPWTETILQHFSDDDIPFGSLFIDQENGTLYGSAIFSNFGNGYVYKIGH
jgi:uncharacterized repeat protein (TIGR03803 family)